ncbi:MAG: CRISPR-associated endonuclease Cas3'' [Proteobacteria bacterium]|nr:CRISPR-associated endonuclease Cas3'' [Pseudomonadota bacterium]
MAKEPSEPVASPSDPGKPSSDENAIAIAHVAPDGRRHDLKAHLAAVAAGARQAAEAFGAGDYAEIAGLWHDLGKYSSAFQHYIGAAAAEDASAETVPGRVNHSSAGAVWAVKRFGTLGRILAYVIAGHHAGLPDWSAGAGGQGALESRLKNDAPWLEAALAAKPPAALLERPLPDTRPGRVDPSLWIRMLFSALVDADFVDTERFFEPDKGAARSQFPGLDRLWEEFVRFKERELDPCRHSSPVNALRAEVLGHCLAKAEEVPGLFSLTVPTGGGKTLSSLGFALRHATRHGLRRVIYVIPFTSIIEQTADVFRGVFARLGNVVVEHHSNLDPDDRKRWTTATRLASENWDAPLIVTTAVQFFESLFAARPSRCRKLHNVAGSVVVLDEAQLLPRDFLKPILHGLRELMRTYGSTVVLCTATQPALDPRPHDKFEGLSGRREIVPDVPALYARLKRVEVEMPADLVRPTDWPELAAALEKEPTVLCIVDRRADARRLCELLPAGAVHLSGLMCGAHRAKTIAEIKATLDASRSLRVVSTQLVEAGVDLDFPAVYRALAGLDSIAQAAGRCNREGRLPRPGRVRVFVPPAPPPPGLLRQGAEAARQALAAGATDPLAPEVFERYFRHLYWMHAHGLDTERILECLKPHDHSLQFAFRTAAEKFRLIPEESVPVVVPYGERGQALVRALRYADPSRDLLRRLQRLTVTVPRRVHAELVRQRVVEVWEMPWPDLSVLRDEHLYDDRLGLMTDLQRSPDDLIF